MIAWIDSPPDREPPAIHLRLSSPGPGPDVLAAAYGAVAGAMAREAGGWAEPTPGTFIHRGRIAAWARGALTAEDAARAGEGN